MDKLILECLAIAVAELGYICFMAYMIYIEIKKSK